MMNLFKVTLLLLFTLQLFGNNLHLTHAAANDSPNYVDIGYLNVQDGNNQSWQIKSANITPETLLNIAITQTDIYPNDTIEVNLTINNAIDLYGLQVSCSADPAVLSWQSAVFGDFFAGPLVGAKNLDAATGTWTGALSQKNPAPPLSGNGSFATFTFQAVTPGTTTITCDPLASDRDGTELPISTVNADIIISEPSGTMDGSISYQGRIDHSGIEITVTGPITTNTQTDITGQFELNPVQVGEYSVQADAELYLPSCSTVTVNNGQVATASLSPLLGGDSDDDGAIKINDAALIGSNLGLDSTTTPQMDTRADINGDGQVNVQDLSILGGNFGKQGCQTGPSA